VEFFARCLTGIGEVTSIAKRAEKRGPVVCSSWQRTRGTPVQRTSSNRVPVLASPPSLTVRGGDNSYWPLVAL